MVMMWLKLLLFAGWLVAGSVLANDLPANLAEKTPANHAAIGAELSDPNTVSSDQNPLQSTQQEPPQRVKRWGFFDILTPAGQNYLLPAHYTYEKLKTVGAPPGDGSRHLEVKFQLHLQAALWRTIGDTPISWYVSYRQTSFWQAYVKSAFFRETNYEPSMYFDYQWDNRPFSLHNVRIGAVHQSNGRGGSAERSWNRAFIQLKFGKPHTWFAQWRLWARIDGLLGARDYNDDITRYLGYGKLRVGYRHQQHVFTVMLRNQLESGFKRGATQLTWSFLVYKRIRGYVGAFLGYGQSLIDYNHRTHSLGVGISFSDYLDD